MVLVELPLVAVNCSAVTGKLYAVKAFDDAPEMPELLNQAALDEIKVLDPL